MDREKILTAVKKAVLDVAPKATVILFGSRSRGDYSEESDWDFLVLSRSKASDVFQKKIRAEVYEVELALNEAISIIIYSKKEWEKLAVTPLYQSVTTDGIAL